MSWPYGSKGDVGCGCCGTKILKKVVGTGHRNSNFFKRLSRMWKRRERTRAKKVAYSDYYSWEVEEFFE